MTKVSGPLFSERVSGRVSPGLTFSQRVSGQQVRWQKDAPDKLTAGRIVARENYLTAVFAWNALTSDQKDVYIERAKNLHLTGYNLFLKENIGAPSLLAIGDLYDGGRIFYLLLPGDSGYDSEVQHGLIAPEVDQSISKFWHYRSDDLVGASDVAIGTGQSNTNLILSVYGAESNAAKLCADLSLNGYDDWYLGSRDEMVKLYESKSFFTPNFFNYYWCSTESTYQMAVLINFLHGGFQNFPKELSLAVRAIRSF